MEAATEDDFLDDKTYFDDARRGSWYFRRLQKIPVMGHEELIEQFKKLEHGDRTSIDRIVRGNLRLVVKIALPYTKKYNHLDELVQEGNLGLLHAIDKFEYRKGYRFSTYATWWIRQAIEYYLTRNGALIRVPVRLVDLQRKIIRRNDANLSKTGKYMDSKELADNLKSSEGAIRRARAWNARKVVSMDDPAAFDEPNFKIEQTLSNQSVGDDPENDFMSGQLLSTFRNVYKHLSPLEKYLLHLRFGGDQKKEMEDDVRKEWLSLSEVKKSYGNATRKKNSRGLCTSGQLGNELQDNGGKASNFGSSRCRSCCDSNEDAGSDAKVGLCLFAPVESAVITK